MPVMESLITIIRDELAKKRTTATAFAREAGLSRQYLYDILNGKSEPTLPLAARLAELCGGKLEIRRQGKKSA